MRERVRSALAVLAVGTLLFPIVAAADRPTYRYIDAGHFSINPDGFDSIDGWRLMTAVPVAHGFHLHGTYARATRSTLRFTMGTAAVGHQRSLAPHTDLVVRAGLARAESRVEDVGRFSDSGPTFSAGARSRFRSNLELSAFVTYTDVGTSETELSLAGYFDLTAQTALFVDVGFMSDATTYGVGFRVRF
jgi:hypothetical protein